MAPGARGQAQPLPPTRQPPGEAAAHRYSLEMLDDKGRVCDLLGDVGNHQRPGDLGEESREGGWAGGIWDISLPPCSPPYWEGRSKMGHRLPPRRLASTDCLNARS